MKCLEALTRSQAKETDNRKRLSIDLMVMRTPKCPMLGRISRPQRIRERRIKKRQQRSEERRVLLKHSKKKCMIKNEQRKSGRMTRKDQSMMMKMINNLTRDLNNPKN
jgi:hypothetical protein